MEAVCCCYACCELIDGRSGPIPRRSHGNVRYDFQILWWKTNELSISSTPRYSKMEGGLGFGGKNHRFGVLMNVCQHLIHADVSLLRFGNTHLQIIIKDVSESLPSFLLTTSESFSTSLEQITCLGLLMKFFLLWFFPIVSQASTRYRWTVRKLLRM